MSWTLNQKLAKDTKLELALFIRIVNGFSEHHSLLFANICHLKTGHISPQYHVVFDNLFETVYITGKNDPIIVLICNNLFDHKRAWCVLKEYDEESKLIYKYPPLYDVWLTEPERQQRK